MAKKKDEQRFIEIQNLSTQVEQTAFDDGTYMEEGRMHVLAPAEVRKVDVRLAELFLEQRYKFVRIFEPNLPKLIPGEEIVYIANATGNPLAPDTVKVEKRTKEGLEFVDRPNANKVARTIREEMKGGQAPGIDMAGEETALNLLPVIFEIPPHRRIPMSATHAEWLLGRSQRRQPEKRGDVVLARPPLGWEPNETWTLTELQVYAGLIDPNGLGLIHERTREIPKTTTRTVKNKETGEEEVVETTEMLTETYYEPEYPNVYGYPEDSYDTPEEADEIRQELRKALFFRQIDERYNPPKEATFRKRMEMVAEARESRKGTAKPKGVGNAKTKRNPGRSTSAGAAA